ncbi:MAG TPA: hemolysin D [Planctomycetaceae bacterium]|nr:hemolysin D [Planctomycetaceae bacterium]
MLTPSNNPEGQTAWPIDENDPSDGSPYTSARPVRDGESDHGGSGTPGDFASTHPTIAARAHNQGAVWSTRGLVINIVIPLLILAAGAGFVVAIGSVQPQARPTPDNSSVGRLKRLPAAQVTQVYSLQELGKPLELRVDGVVVPHREVQLAAEVAGRVIEKSPLCRAGNFVKEGQLLIKIDPTDYEQEVLRLSRMRDQDYEALKEVDQEIENANMSLDIARQDITLAEREVARLRSLPKGFVSEGEIDLAQKALLQSTQSRIAIENQKNLLAARRGRLEAAERLATTQLETAKINLQRCEVRSVADGVIVREDAEVNSFIQRGNPIVTLEDVSKAEVAVNLRMDQLYWVLDQNRESRLGGASVGDGIDSSQGRDGYSIPLTPALIEYEVSGMGGRTYRWNGTLVRYDGIGMDSRSRTVPVKIEVDQPNRLLQPDGSETLSASPSALVRGMYVSVRLLIKPQTPLVAIPSDAIRPGNRIWQFSVDPSVLTEPLPGEPAGGGETASDNAPVAPTKIDPFDPAMWTAGRVTVRGNLTPVDSLYLGESEENTANGSRTFGDKSMVRGQRRYWVCDVQGSGIVGGDYVVTSPLGELGPDLGDAALSVRVMSESLSP